MKSDDHYGHHNESNTTIYAKVNDKILANCS